MKRRLLTAPAESAKTFAAAFTLVFCAMALASCTRIETIDGGGYVPGQPASLTFNATVLGDDKVTTRATHPGDDIDRTMNSLRMLVFQYVPSKINGVADPNYSTEQCVLLFNFYFDENLEENIEVDIPTGEYHILFIANEDSDPELKADLNDTDPAGAISNLHRLVDMSATAAAICDTLPIPMVSHYPWVKVNGVDDVEYRNPFDMPNTEYVPESGIWPVQLERLGIRMEITLTLDEAQYAAWTDRSITIDKIPGSVLIKQQENNDEATRTSRDYFASESTAIGGVENGNIISGTISAAGTGGSRTVTYSRVILPEKAFGDTQHGGSTGTVSPFDAEKAFVLSLQLGAKTFTVPIVLPGDDNGNGLYDARVGNPAPGQYPGDRDPFAKYGHTIVRNTLFRMGAKISDDWNTLHITADVLPWNRVNMEFSGGTWEFDVNRDVLRFPVGGGVQAFEVFTTFSLDDKSEWAMDGWILDPDPVNRSANLGGMITDLPNFLTHSAPSNTTTTVTVTVAENDYGVPREGWFTIRAGNMLKRIKVVQACTVPRITWDTQNGRYVLTDDPSDAGLYFKYGSVVGIYSGIDGRTKDLNFESSNWEYNVEFMPQRDLPWNLTNITEPDEDGYEEVPYTGTNTTINSAYHTLANVRAGKGDPCRLVGLDLNAIKNGTSEVIDNGLWRLPTSQENIDFAELPETYWWNEFTLHWWSRNQPGNISNGIPGAELPRRNGGTGKFLPAVGFRDPEGYVTSQGEIGHFWSSDYCAYEPGDWAYKGYNIGFTNHFLMHYDDDDVSLGFGVRCVRQMPGDVTAEPAKRVPAANSYIIDAAKTAIRIPARSHVNEAYYSVESAISLPESEYPDDFSTLKVGVLWSDIDEFGTDDAVVKSVSFSGEFEENSDKYITVIPGNGVGNAVVMLWDEFGGAGDKYDVGTDKIVWTWHIWNWGGTDYPYNFVGTGCYPTKTWLDRNLGAINNGTAGIDIGTMGLHYQWGRKDPHPGPNFTPGDDQGAPQTAYIGPDVSPRNGIKYDTRQLTGTVTNNLSAATRNPLMRYWHNHGDTFDWFRTSASTSHQNLWGVNGNSTTTQYSAKSVYDPCPYGYRVPKWGEWNFDAVWPNENGWHRRNDSYGGWYPATGYMDEQDHGLLENIIKGRYWTATMMDEDAIAGMIFEGNNNSTVEADDTHHSDDRSVRCIRDPRSISN